MAWHDSFNVHTLALIYVMALISYEKSKSDMILLMCGHCIMVEWMRLMRMVDLQKL